MYKFICGMMAGIVIYAGYLFITNELRDNLLDEEIGMLSFSSEPEIITGIVVGQSDNIYYGKTYEIEFAQGTGVSLQLSVSKSILDDYFNIQRCKN